MTKFQQELFDYLKGKVKNVYNGYKYAFELSPEIPMNLLLDFLLIKYPNMTPIGMVALNSNFTVEVSTDYYGGFDVDGRINYTALEENLEELGYAVD